MKGLGPSSNVSATHFSRWQSTGSAKARCLSVTTIAAAIRLPTAAATMVQRKTSRLDSTSNSVVAASSRHYAVSPGPNSSSISVTSAAIGERSLRTSVTCANSGCPLSFSMTAATPS
ncbi:Uncharacterised protein [Mycobacteroides abscessus subsp. abscessus]|nr:Uncharacterised protein [Mycobacteroides abscessus subsp. abscessus]